MADRLEFNFVGNDHITALLEKMERIGTALDKVVDRLGESTRGMGRQMAAAERDVDQLGTEMDQAARQAENLGDELDELARDAGHVDRQIQQLKDQLRDLAVQFDRTGDADVLEKLLATRKTLARLQAVKNTLGGIADVGEDVGEGLLKSISHTLEALPSQVKGGLYVGLAAVAASAAPFIGGAIASAVLGGIGVGGILGGVALAAQDTRVGQAAEQVADRVSAAFLRHGGAFVAPTLDALELLAGAAERFASSLDLHELADEVAPLAEGLAHFADTIMPGVNDALETAEPLIRVIAREMPMLGVAISDALQTISEEGDGAVLALATLFDVIEGGVRIGSQSIALLSRQWEALVKGMAATSGAAEDIWGWIPGIGDRFRDTNDKTEGWLRTLELSKDPINTTADTTGRLALELERQTRAAHDAAEALDTLAGTTQDLRLAELGMRDALAEIKLAREENGRTLDINTQKGRDNLRVIEAAISAADRAGKAAEDRALAEGKSADVAAAAGAKVREQWIAELEKSAAKAGFSRQEIEKLVAAYKAADGTRLRLYQDIIRTVVDRRDSKLNKTPYSSGGLVDGDGPKGVDSVAAILAPGEYVLPADVVDRLGVRNLDLLRSGEPPSTIAGPPVRPAPSTVAGGDIVIINRIVAPDGRLITESQQRYARQSGIRTVEQLLDMPAV